MKVSFSDIGQVPDKELKFAVISSSFQGKWVFVKHKLRETWEIPGGHREKDEDINDTAKRELYEETGAIDFEISSICDYLCDYSLNERNESSYGRLFYAEIKELGKLPDSEIGEVKLFNTIPKNLTYKAIMPYLHEKVLEKLNKED